MKITCYRRSLLSAYELCIGAVARDVKPCLRNLKLTATNDTLVLMATNLDEAIRADVRPGLKVSAPGEALIPARLLLEILQKSDGAGEEVEIASSKDKRILISIGADKYEIDADDPAGFPDMPTFKSKNFHQMTVGDLHGAIKQTAYAAAMYVLVPLTMTK